jgi:hypothetical protein
MVSIVLIFNLYGGWRLMQYFTNWTLLITIAYHCAGMWASRNSNLSALAVHHLLFEMAVLMNLVVMSIYWGSLHEQSVKDVHGNFWELVNLYWTHLVPFTSVVLNFSLTDIVVRASHARIILPVGITYAYINYLEVKRLGYPLYFFWTWEDYTSVVVLFVLMATFMIVFFMLEKFTVWLKRS